MDLENRQEPLEFYWKLLKKPQWFRTSLRPRWVNNSYHELNNYNSFIHVKNNIQLYARNYFINFAKGRWDTGSHLILAVFSCQETDHIKFYKILRIINLLHSFNRNFHCSALISSLKAICLEQWLWRLPVHSGCLETVIFH